MNAVTVRAGALGVSMALVAVLVTYLVADAASGPLLVTQPGSGAAEEVPVRAVLGFTVVGGAVGIGFALVVDRLGRPASTFVALSVAALVLYGIVPFTAAEESTTAIWLNVMHVAAAVPIIGFIARALTREDESPAVSATEPQRTTA